MPFSSRSSSFTVSYISSARVARSSASPSSGKNVSAVPVYSGYRSISPASSASRTTAVVPKPERSSTLMPLSSSTRRMSCDSTAPSVSILEPSVTGDPWAAARAVIPAKIRTIKDLRIVNLLQAGTRGPLGGLPAPEQRQSARRRDEDVNAEPHSVTVVRCYPSHIGEVQPMPAFMTDPTILGNSPLQWLFAVLLGAGVYYGLHDLLRLFRSQSTRLRGKERLRADHIAIKLLGDTQPWLIAVAALYAMSLVLRLEPVLALRLRQGLLIAVVIRVALWGNAALTFIVARYGERTDLDGGKRTSLAVITFMSRAVLYVLLLLVVLDTLGINITALVAGLGIGSIAVALAV